MTSVVRETAASRTLDVRAAAALSTPEVLQALGVSGERGLTTAEAERRRVQGGPNAVAAHRTGLLLVLWHQVRSPLLGLLLAAAAASFFVGERADAVIIAVIVAMSIGLSETGLDEVLVLAPTAGPARGRNARSPSRRIGRRAATSRVLSVPRPDCWPQRASRCTSWRDPPTTLQPWATTL